MAVDNELQWRRGKRVAVIGAGPGGVSAGLALHQQGYDVRIYERHSKPKPLGGAVLLSSPVLAILRYYGIDLDNFGSFTRTEFRNARGKVRARLPFNPSVEASLGIEGWHYGVLRSDAFGCMMDRLPAQMLVPDSVFSGYEQTPSGVRVEFNNGKTVEADIVVGADGIHSQVSAQAFGEPPLFHVGLRVWLAWCEAIEGIPQGQGAISHSRKFQASYFPMTHHGKPGFEWWVVEPRKEHDPEPHDARAHLQKILNRFGDPLPRFLEATDFSRQVFPWDIYNRPSLKTWSDGRVVCLGDAVHPVSPYAAYGMGMAIEDGYFLGKALGGRDLGNPGAVAEGFNAFEAERVDYVNHQVEFARKLGNQFHRLPLPLALLRDCVFDNTTLLQKLIEKDYLRDQERMGMSLRELHVTP